MEYRRLEGCFETRRRRGKYGIYQLELGVEMILSDDYESDEDTQKLMEGKTEWNVNLVVLFFPCAKNR